jgi:hypothetical protein
LDQVDADAAVVRRDDFGSRLLQQKCDQPPVVEPVLNQENSAVELDFQRGGPWAS